MKILPLALLLMLSTSGCAEFGGSYLLVSDGYRFNFEGVTAERSEAGAVAAGIRRIEVDHGFGEVRVLAAAPGEATGWQWSTKVWVEDPALAQMVLDEVGLVIREDGGTMAFELSMPEVSKDDLRGLRSDLTLLVDSATELQMSNEHGDARVEGLDGDISFEVRHGDSHFAALSGRLDGVQAHGELFADGIQGAKFEASHGDVTVRNGGPLEVTARHGAGTYDGIRGGFTLQQDHGDVEIHDGPLVEGESSHAEWRVVDVEGLTLKSRHGDVYARLLSGSARVHTEHGDVTIERAGVASDAPSADHIRTQHGSVKLDLRHNGYADIDASHGDVTIYHAMGASAAIDAQARHGDVRSSLPRVDSLRAGQAGAKVRTSHGDIRCVAAGQR